MENRIWQDTAMARNIIGQKGKDFAILIHVNPDGDAVGSSLGLLNLLQKIGHKGFVISPNDYPGFLKWMQGSDKIIVYNKTPGMASTILKSADIIFALDFNELNRMKDINGVYQQAGGYKILIDHHPDPVLSADCIISDIASSSTAELVLDFIKDIGCTSFLDVASAECLFAGIMSDTGCFSYNSSNKKTWQSVAELLDYGINKDRIYSSIYDNFSADRMRLLGYSINDKMVVLPEFHTGYIWLSREDLKKFNFKTGDTEGFVNYPLSVKGIWFSALFTENDTHVRISFRSKGDFPVNEFARRGFNGGGHANASGAESDMSMEDTIKRFKELLNIYKDALAENTGE